jgi:CRISPR system Cascade subunit CasA
MMVPSFNLVDQPWIPCLQHNGQVAEFSLRDLFAHAHELVDVAADSPMENAALYRFLLAILHRTFGPANSMEWERLWQENTFSVDAIDQYLTSPKQYDRFDLFSPNYPFGQFNEDKRVNPKSIVSLKHGFGMLPSGWFNHEVETENRLEVRLSPSQATRDLLTVLAFGFGGLSGIPGVSHTDALCTKGVIFIVQGNNLKQTLMLNLVQYRQDAFSDNLDLPFWEMEDPLEFDRIQPFGLLDHYSFPSRNIKLYLDPKKLEHNELEIYQYRLGLGLRTNEILDPMKHYHESKSAGLLPLTFNRDRQLWRNSSSLFEINPIGKKPPAIFNWLHTLIEAKILDRHMLFQCKAMGISKNQGRADYARQEQFPLPLSVLTDEQKLSQLKAAIDSVERTSWVLERALALTSMYLHLDEPEKYNWEKKQIMHPGADKELGRINTTETQIVNWMTYTGAERHFWSALDVSFLQFMEKLGEASSDDLLAVKIWWQAEVRASAHNAFRQVLQYTNQTPRAFKAFAYGNNRLQGYLNKNFPQEKIV